MRAAPIVPVAIHRDGLFAPPQDEDGQCTGCLTW